MNIPGVVQQYGLPQVLDVMEKVHSITSLNHLIEVVKYHMIQYYFHVHPECTSSDEAEDILKDQTIFWDNFRYIPTFTSTIHQSQFQHWYMERHGNRFIDSKKEKPVKIFKMIKNVQPSCS